MPRKTLALISGLVLVTLVLFVIALQASKQEPKKTTGVATPSTSEQPVPTVPVHTVLALSPNPLTVAPGQQGTVDVTIDTEDNDVTAVQLELSYDPMLITNVKVVSGPLFKTPVVLINKNDAQKGTFTYAYGILPNQQPVKGKGVAATITFTAKYVAGKQAELKLLPTTLVTARGVSSSVLKSSTGTTIMIGAPTSPTAAVVTEAPLVSSTPAPTP